MRFDELSITDDEFADALAAAENDLMMRTFAASSIRNLRNNLKPIILPRHGGAKREILPGHYRFLLNQPDQIGNTDSCGRYFSAVRDLFAARPLEFGFAMAAILILILSGWWFFAGRRAAPETAIKNTPSLIAPPQSDRQENTNESRPCRKRVLAA